MVNINESFFESLESPVKRPFNCDHFGLVVQRIVLNSHDKTRVQHRTDSVDVVVDVLDSPELVRCSCWFPLNDLFTRFLRLSVDVDV